MVKLLLENGAGGHMAHPFDVPWVKTGKDLLSFFTDNINKYIEENEPAVKFDGTNVSFKLVEEKKADGSSRYEFAVDRGSMKPIDLKGVTADRIGLRFPEGHGMRDAIKSLLEVFNVTLWSGTINEELEILGLFDNSNLFFNTEYVFEREDEQGQKTAANVVLYNEDFFAIHGVKVFYQVKSPKRESISRATKEINLNTKQKTALQSLIAKARRFSKNFNIYGPEDSKVSKREAGSVNYDDVLSTSITIFSTPDNPVTNTLGGWLRNPDITNPFDAVIKTSLHPKGKAGALSKFVYTSLIPELKTPISVSELLGTIDGTKIDMVKQAISGAIFYHATRLLGKKVLDNFTTNIGSPDLTKHEGIILRNKEIFNFDRPIKLTGDFIIRGMGGRISQLISQPSISTKKSKVGKVVALIPGAFKPPHRGHLDMVKHYADLADNVIIMISKLSRKTPGGKDITVEDSSKIWDLYISSAGLINVIIKSSPHASPVRAAYEFVDEGANIGDQIILGTSTKEGDQSRFAKNVQKYAKEGVQILDPLEYAFEPIGEELSASDFRAALETGENIERFLPANITPEMILSILKFENQAQLQEVDIKLVLSFIEEALDERDYQKESERLKRHSKMRMSTKGPKIKKAPYVNDPPSNRGKSAPPLGEDAIEPQEEETLKTEISAVSVGAVEFSAGKKDKKKKKIVQR